MVFSYVLKKKSYGYQYLKNQEGGQQVVLGKVYKADRDNDYIVKAGDLSGSAYFDTYGNFVLERINPVSDRLIMDVFVRK